MMEHCQDSDVILDDSICSDVREPPNNQLPRPVDATRPASVRMAAQEVDVLPDGPRDAARRCRIVQCDVVLDRLQVPRRGPRPPDLHCDAAASGS